jgi:hypothetical protein
MNRALVSTFLKGALAMGENFGVVGVVRLLVCIVSTSLIQAIVTHSYQRL